MNRLDKDDMKNKIHIFIEFHDSFLVKNTYLLWAELFFLYINSGGFIVYFFNC